MQMTRQPTGHVSVNVCDFGDRGLVDFMCLLTTPFPTVKCGPRRPFPTGPHSTTSRMGKPCLSLARWRRLLLRLYTFISLQAHQCMLEVCRSPQFRQVRRLQQQRERLEQKVYALQQAEQKMTAEAAASTETPTGTLNISRDEFRHRPLACIRLRHNLTTPAPTTRRDDHLVTSIGSSHLLPT